MATHAYVILSQFVAQDGSADPAVVIKGTVDGLAVTVNTWFSVINKPTALGYQNAVTPLMLAAWQALQGPTTQNPPTNSWTQ